MLRYVRALARAKRSIVRQAVAGKRRNWAEFSRVRLVLGIADRADGALRSCQ